MAKIGVFTCWCGENIARHVDVERVAKAIESLPGVHCSMNYKYMCSEPGQSLIICGNEQMTESAAASLEHW